jgi:hypothetical protein
MTDEERQDIRDQVVEDYENRRNARLLQIGMGLLGILVLGVSLFFYIAHEQQESDQRWCSLMASLDDRYQALPRNRLDAEGREFADKIHVLRQQLHCGPSDLPSPLPSAAPETPARSTPPTSVTSSVPTSNGTPTGAPSIS